MNAVLKTEVTETIYYRNDWNTFDSAPAFVGAILAALRSSGVVFNTIDSSESWRNSRRECRGVSINTDYVGWDENRGLAVIQMRECHFRTGRFNSVRKDYFLVGFNENGTSFMHSIDSPLRSKIAMASPEATVAYVLSKIWDVKIDELDDIIRQGDLAFVPVYRLPAGAVKLDVDELVLRDSHVLKGEIWKHGDDYYCRRGARMKHVKGEHASIRAKGGLYRVAEGHRSPIWNFRMSKVTRAMND